jgi:hypothetical protein
MKHTILYCLLGMAATFTIWWLLKVLIAPKTKFRDFLTGDQGKYSLSRLQASLWAFFIISYQVSVYITMASIRRANEFKLVFSEQLMWILGITLGVYIGVKGITNNQINSGKMSAPPTQPVPNAADFITSEEGLDLSRFQMLIWTMFALVTFVASYGYYIYQILYPLEAQVKDWKGDYGHFFPQMGTDDKNILPGIDMSFIVLMGLSQGAYIGRKLVPTYKTDSFIKDNLEKLQQRETGLAYTQKQYELMLMSSSIPADKKQVIQQKLNDIKSQQNDIATEKAGLQQTGS